MRKWDEFVEHRPRIEALLGPEGRVLGHAAIKERLHALGSVQDTAEFLVLNGSVGSGKTALLDWLKTSMGGRAVDVRQVIATLSRRLDPEGEDVGRLINALRPQVQAAGERAVLVYDDIDHEFRLEGMIRFVRQSIPQLAVGSLVATVATPMPDDGFLIPTTTVSLDRRLAGPAELNELISSSLQALDQPAAGFSDDLRSALYELSEQASDFNAIEFVIELLLAHAREIRGTATSADLQDLLDSDSVRELRLPSVRVAGGHLTFFRKDKTEQLADLLYRSFTRAEDLAQAATRRLPGFDRHAFLEECQTSSYADARMSLCLTTSPVELVAKLIPRTDVRAAIDRLDLDPSDLFAAGEEEEHLLIRGLGFTLIQEPRGLPDFLTAVRAAGGLLDADPEPRVNVVNAAGLGVVQQIEEVLNDLLHIWGSFVFGSVRACVDAFNVKRPDEAVNLRRLTDGQMLALLRFIGQSARDDEVAFTLRPLRLTQPIPAKLLDACTSFVDLRNEQMHGGRGLLGTDPAPDGFVDICRELVAAGIRVINEAEKSFPAVIKLSEIVFDEYSRRIFRGIDSNGDDIRFGLTDENRADHLEVAAHYYMLPRRRVVVNPYIVPRSGAARPVLFERADDYINNSDTQKSQARHLHEQVVAAPGETIIDVGCGGGRDAVLLAGRFPESTVIGIDNSPAMVDRARELAEQSGVANATFEEADLLTYSTGELFDVVYSSSLMHWFGATRFEEAYRRLLHLLRTGGRLYVHQGGRGTYRGLRRLAQQVITDYGYGRDFLGFKYPLHYPTRDELTDLLHDIGFVDVLVESRESSGQEAPTLPGDFAEAGLAPYLERLPEVRRDLFKQRFLKRAAANPPDLYIHRLYATARRP